LQKHPREVAASPLPEIVPHGRILQKGLKNAFARSVQPYKRKGRTMQACEGGRGVKRGGGVKKEVKKIQPKHPPSKVPFTPEKKKADLNSSIGEKKGQYR